MKGLTCCPMQYEVWGQMAVWLYKRKSTSEMSSPVPQLSMTQVRFQAYKHMYANISTDDDKVGIRQLEDGLANVSIKATD